MTKKTTKKTTEKLAKKPDGRGGYREGAGKKAKHGKTVVKRIPQQYESAVFTFIEHLSQHSQSDVEELVTTIDVGELNRRVVSVEVHSSRKKN